MLKKRYGKITETVPGRQWRWEIPEWSKKGPDKIMDSELMTSFSGAMFHFHLIFEEKNDKTMVGFYIHYKQRPVPKYTYAFGSTQGRVVRQHTAHSIPKSCKRCGHFNVCQNVTLKRAIERAGDDTCVVWFQFDDCTLANTGNLGEFVWTIRNFRSIRIGPYYSTSFPRVTPQDLCCIKLTVDPKLRTNVVISVAQRQQRSIPCWFKCTNLEGELLYKSPEALAEQWPSVPYSALTSNLGREGTLIVYISHFKEVMQEEEKAPISLSNLLPPPGERIHEDADGRFNVMDDGDMEMYSDADEDPELELEAQAASLRGENVTEM
ncbi:hypothetical protein DIPPA_28105 [Diplonema papillatum]|nr:hypothetical protein DIPPA_28105 [Diplonema papillatum]